MFYLRARETPRRASGGELRAVGETRKKMMRGEGTLVMLGGECGGVTNAN